MKRVKLLNKEIDTFSFEGAIEYATGLLDANQVSQVVTINPEMFNTAKTDQEFSAILDNAEMVIPDGVGVKLGLKIMGENVDRIAGCDFARRMIDIAAQKEMGVALIGAKPEIVEKAVQNLTNEVPNINIVYYHDGYFNSNEEILNELKLRNAKLILVALGSPKQEKFINEAKSILKDGLMIGVGGSFDVWSGMVQRAPKIYQKLGLEWLYRTIKQPERFKRIFPALPLFVLKVLDYKFRGDKSC